MARATKERIWHVGCKRTPTLDDRARGACDRYHRTHSPSVTVAAPPAWPLTPASSSRKHAPPSTHETCTIEGGEACEDVSGGLRSAWCVSVSFACTRRRSRLRPFGPFRRLCAILRFAARVHDTVYSAMPMRLLPHKCAQIHLVHLRSLEACMHMPSPHVGECKPPLRFAFGVLTVPGFVIVHCGTLILWLLVVIGHDANKHT